MFVIDASAMLAWCFVEERPPNADALLKKLEEEGLAAPSHWSLEITNILINAERAGRADPSGIAAFLSVVDNLGVEIDHETSRRAWSDIRALAVAERLTAYDAAYLELALRLGASLVSKDKDLLAAANRRKTPTMDLTTRRR